MDAEPQPPVAAPQTALATPKAAAANPKSSGSPPIAKAPFAADEAKAHQEAWAEYLKNPVEYTNSIGMKLRLIPPGEFMMGSTVEEIDNIVLCRKRAIV